MIIARTSTPAGPGINDAAQEFLLLGLSRENVKRLTTGRPIRITRATHGDGVPEGWTVAIVFGETELQIKAALFAAGLIGPDTEFRIDPRLK